MEGSPRKGRDREAMSEVLDAAIFDLDGTLVDTLGDFVAALDATLAELGLPAVDPALVARTIGKGADHIVGAVLAAAGCGDEAVLERARLAYRANYVAINGRHARVYPGVREGLAALSAAGVRLACVTNKLGAFARPLLRAKDLDRHFVEICCGDRHGRLKPDPVALVKTCELLDAAPGRTLVVGDSSNDALAARAAGCPVVLVTYGYNHGEPVRAVDADGFVDSIEGLARDAARYVKADRNAFRRYDSAL